MVFSVWKNTFPHIGKIFFDLAKKIFCEFNFFEFQNARRNGI